MGRAKRGGSLSLTPAKRARIEPGARPFAASYFENLLKDAGLELQSEHHILNHDTHNFVQKLKSILEDNVDFPRNVTEFVKGFECYMDDGDNLESVLSHNILQKTDDEDDGRIVQNSLAHMLLSVTCLQAQLTDMLLTRATQYAIDEKLDRVQMLLKPFVLLDDLTSETRLAEGIIQLLQVPNHAIRLEIIICLPDILSHREHYDVALELCKVMSADHELTPAILECLSYFWLPNDLKIEVRNKMLTMLRTSAPLHLFPNIVNFFFIGCMCEHDQDVIRGLRDGLDWTSVEYVPDVDADSSQLMTILSLKAALAKSKNLTADWVKEINRMNTPGEHKPLDIIILIIIYSLKNGREKIVENIFKKRIKSLLFTSSLIKKTIKMFKSTVNEFILDILQLCKVLLMNKIDQSVKEFAIYWFTVLFEESEDSRRIIIGDLIHQEFIEEGEALSNSLIVLSEVAKDNMNALKPFSFQISGLINKLDVLNASDVSQVMNLLCGLAFSVENSIIQDDIHLLIRKQLSSSNIKIKSRGITAGVMAIKHMVCSEDCKPAALEGDYSQINCLPEGAPKEAALIIALIMKSTSKFSDMLCYFYDEFANMLENCKNIEPAFLSWLTQMITDDFQTNFVIDNKDFDRKSIDEIELSSQFCLDATDDIEEPISINIAILVIGPNPENVDLRTLPSWYRVVQIVHKKANDGDLSTIDALLGCGIILPVLHDEENLDEFEPSYIEKILHCLIYCINWYRESVSAFCLQKDEQIKKKVIGRLNGLLIMEKKLAKYISNNKGLALKLPICMFGLSNDLKGSSLLIYETKLKKKDKKKPRKSKKKNQSPEAETSGLNGSSDTQIDSAPNNEAGGSGEKCKLNTSLFRSLHIETINFLEENLCIENYEEDKSDSKIYLDSLLFLINEINPKLNIIFPNYAVKKIGPFSKPSKCTNTMMNTKDAMQRCFAILPKLFNHMEKIAEYTQKCIDDNDGVRDASSLFSEVNAKCQQCLTEMFQMLLIIFSWSGFLMAENKSQLVSCFKIIADRRESNDKRRPLKELISESSVYLSKYKDWCLSVSAAAGLVKLLHVIAKTNNDKNLFKNMIDVSFEMLSLNWRNSYGDVEKGLQYNQHIDTLLSTYFCNPEVAVVKTIAMDVFEQCPQLSNKNSSLLTFQCINKANFPLLFRALCRALCESTKTEIDKGLTDKQHLELWRDVFITMKLLTDILKFLENRSNLTAFLKKSIPLLRLFLSHGMPMMDMKLKTEPDSVVEILRTLQHSTRFLHTLYCHSRLKEDTALIAHLPQMKFILESLVYKVKASLVVNDCREAFWMGNLKNKNMKGEIIPSQCSSNGDSDSGDEEDQLPADENSSDDEEDNSNVDMKSISNIL